MAEYLKTQGGHSVVKVNQEKLQEKIKKLKKKAADVIGKSGGKTDTAEVRKARKKVKREQRKLRSAKAYKSGGKKAGEAKPAEEKATA
jgi:predicted CopG family antitoxin